MFNGTAYHPGIGALYVGMSDHCAWYIKNPNLIPEIGGFAIKDWSAAAKLRAPKGWITAVDGATGTVLWRYRTESQVLAGLVPTKSGLLFAGDTHGNLLVFDATNGRVLKRIDVGGALNSGLISYQVDGEQYVAAAVGGTTENPSTVAGPLRVSIYGLHGPDKPQSVTLNRLDPSDSPEVTAVAWLYIQNCAQCHGAPKQAAVIGSSAPPSRNRKRPCLPCRREEAWITNFRSTSGRPGRCSGPFLPTPRSFRDEAPRSAIAPDTQRRPAQRLPDENANRAAVRGPQPGACGPVAHRMAARRAVAVG
jgi:PQQ-like domain